MAAVLVLFSGRDSFAAEPSGRDDDELDRRIDDAAAKLRSDRPWSRPGTTGFENPIRCASYCPGTRNDGWSFSFTPFLWAPAMHGHMTIKGQNVPVDSTILEGLEDVFDNFEFAFMGRLEARKCKWSVLVDVIYLKIGNDADVDVGAAQIRADWQTQQLTLQGMLGYEVARLPLGCGDPCFRPSLTIDALAGFRLYFMEGDVNPDPGPDFSGDQTWADPLVGFRALFHVTPALTFNLSADAGGFGIGSDLSWRLIAGIDYKINGCVSLDGGWAILDVDYEHGSFAYDVTQSGPYLGATFRF